MKLICAKFLEKNFKDQSSDYPVFHKPDSDKFTNIRLDTITSEKSLQNILNTFKLTFKTLHAPDSSLLNTAYIEEQIEQSVQLYNKYAWNQDIPIDIFLNYLLPYKIHNEYPDDWRDYLSKHYDSIIQLRNRQISKNPSDDKLKDAREFYYTILVDNISDLFNYNDQYMQLTEYPSFYELLSSKKGGCFRSSYMNTYILRSLGLPATVDILPFWGSKNGSHASEVFWDIRQAKFSTGPGRQLDRPAKVFRLSFEKQNLWTDSIKPYVNEELFYLNNLKNDHLIDVTGEHTTTSNISINLKKEAADLTFAYICIYNYGNWMPIFWGNIDLAGQALFKKMGQDVLYRIAVASADTIKYVDPIFALDTTGSLIFFRPIKNIGQAMLLTKLNTGKEMWVKKGVVYSLLILDSTNKWAEWGHKECLKDSIVAFNNVPSNTLYRLVSTTGDRRLERIFSYNNKKQIWW